MMKKKLNVALAVFMVMAAAVWAQSKDKVAKPRVKAIPVYLGQSGITDGSKLAKQTFDSLLRQGLTSKDSAGLNFKVDGFTLTYGERNLYEDSVGNLMWLTDYLAEYCYGDTLSTFLLDNITGRSKPGDTVYFDQITVRSPEGKAALGRGMRLVLTK